jgi:hypothetical protein
MAIDIVDLAMPTDATGTTTFKVWTTVNTLFSAIKKTREVYLSEEFRNINEEDWSISDYLHLHKTTADALAEVDAPVTAWTSSPTSSRVFTSATVASPTPPHSSRRYHLSHFSRHVSSPGDENGATLLQDLMPFETLLAGIWIVES